ncbi:MAG: ATP-binding cassette domain-containing protein [Eubacterium sp.]|nr:ATP-binding cassette domain-containing protein [Eubacterium sp.]
MDYALQTNLLTKIYGSARVVNDVSMHVEKGSIYGFIGRNGAGKTTFMRMAAGLAAPSAGSMTLFGSKDLEKQRVRIGTLIENPGIYPGMTALENIETVRKSLGIPGSRRTEELLRLTGLADTGRKKAKHFSMGMKQRLGIAIALLRNPDFLILDEPINGLDPAGIKEIRDLLLRLNQEKQMTILISSHILGELSKIATHYGIIRNGSLIEEFDVSELEQRCRRCLKLSVDKPQEAANILERALGIKSFDVPQAGMLRVFERLDESADINEALVKNGIRLQESRLAGQDLEGYFMELLGSNPIEGGAL